MSFFRGVTTGKLSVLHVPTLTHIWRALIVLSVLLFKLNKHTQDTRERCWEAQEELGGEDGGLDRSHFVV